MSQTHDLNVTTPAHKPLPTPLPSQFFQQVENVANFTPRFTLGHASTDRTAMLIDLKTRTGKTVSVAYSFGWGGNVSEDTVWTTHMNIGDALKQACDMLVPNFVTDSPTEFEQLVICWQLLYP